MGVCGASVGDVLHPGLVQGRDLGLIGGGSVLPVMKRTRNLRHGGMALSAVLAGGPHPSLAVWPFERNAHHGSVATNVRRACWLLVDAAESW